MPTKEAYVRARIDPSLKKDAEKILDQLGLTTAEAIRIFLNQVKLRRGLPFSVNIPDGDNDDILLPAAMRRAALDAVYED